MLHSDPLGNVQHLPLAGRNHRTGRERPESKGVGTGGTTGRKWAKEVRTWEREAERQKRQWKGRKCSSTTTD